MAAAPVEDGETAMIVQTEKDKLARLVAELEKQTSGEIVTMVVGRSDDYPGARWRCAVLFSLLALFLVYFLFPEIDPLYLLFLHLPALYIGYLLSAVPAVLRCFLIEDKVSEEVHQRATQEFFAQNVHETSHRSGVFIFVSLLERRAEILADTGINARAEPDTWQKVLQDMLAHFRGGRLYAGLEHAIKSCGDILCREFPAEGDSVPDELKNHVIFEE